MESRTSMGTRRQSHIRLNGFQLKISEKEFKVYTQPLADNKELKLLRQKFENEWFLHWRQGVAYGLPLVSSPKEIFGKEMMLNTQKYEGLSLLTSRINDVLPQLLPQCEPIRRGRLGWKKFIFLAQRTELVSEIIKDWKNVHPIVQGFKIRPKFICEARLLELRPEEFQIILLLNIEMSWSVDAEIHDLINAGISLKGLYAVRRHQIQGERRLVGRILDIKDEKVMLEESGEGISNMPASEIQLEGSREVFAKCLKVLLPDRYMLFNSNREKIESDFLTGQGIDRCWTQFLRTFKKNTPLELCRDISVTLGEQVDIQNTAAFTTFIELDPVEYCFDAGKTKRHQYSWQGLEAHGPYSRDTFSKRSPRVLVVCPDSVQSRIEQSLNHLRKGIPQTPFSKGFERTFNLINIDFAFCYIPLSKERHSNPAQLYRKYLEDYLAEESSFEAAFVVVLDEHALLPSNHNPYLHAKALLLTHGIPVQEAKVSTLTSSTYNLSYTLQNISVALYAKMNGTPWTVNHGLTVNDEIVVGMGLAEFSGSRMQAKQRHVGITTVFRGDGNYLLADVSKDCSYDDYPNVLMDSMTSILKEIQHRNGWNKGDIVRVVFHASKPLRNLEIDSLMKKCVDEAIPEQKVQFAFLDVLHDHPFRILDYSQPGRENKNQERKGIYVPKRGLSVQIGKNTHLLCANGILQIKRPTTPLPAPLLIHLHPYSTGCDLHYLTDQILKFTSLTWRSVHPAYTPVTIYYSELIAELLLRLKQVPDWSPACLNTKLRFSKWFL